MKILRTPDKSFDVITDFPYEPCYTNIKTKDGSELRIHHIDEGPKDGPILLAMHGQPVWCYLYSRMIPFLTKAGIRVIAPDLPGYGKSDKPASRSDYSYQNQVDWMVDWLNANDFKDIAFFGQDWGGLIGLRVVAREPYRFSKVSMGNTGLPYNPDAPEEVVEEIKTFRESDIKLHPLSMAKKVREMDNGKTHPGLKFMYWQKFCWDTEDLPIGFIQSMQMEKKSLVSTFLNYIFILLGKYSASPFKSYIAKAYEAPFPDPSYKMGPRAMPSQVPIIPDQSLEEQKKAREFFSKWDKPFLSVFAGDDPVTNGIEQDVLNTLESQLGIFEEIGCHINQADPDFTDANEVFLRWRGWERVINQGDLLEKHRDTLKDSMIWDIEQGLKLSASDVAWAETKRIEIFRRMENFMEKYNFLICPVSQSPPFDINQPWVKEINGVQMDNYIDWMRSCYYITVTGHPAISVPCGFTEQGLPVGIQIVGRYRDDLGVLQLAKAFESATEFWKTVPDISK